ncbi:MAG: rubrerythrin family protein [Dorea sp.]|uniref:rubrerythrin family protein n=1 Tax=Dorea sp. YH-dor226 TaxID=3151119 RepID=UPI003063B7A8|nr:rubrerythrin family protein [Dorea sp.]
MAVDFKNSETKVNLMKAFAGESQARNRYTIAAQEAREKKYYAIGEVFLFTADQERAHAKRFYDLLKNLNGETIDIEGSYPVDYDDSITGLLRAAQHNEMEEADDVYMAFGEKAKEEGFIEAASAFFHIARIEAVHGKRFGLLAELLESGRYYETGRTGYWMCLNCGYIHKGTRVPEVCPTCLEEKGYFIPADLAPYLRGDLIVVY